MEAEHQEEERSPEEVAATIIAKGKRGISIDPRLAFELAFVVLQKDERTALALDAILGCADHDEDFLELATFVLMEAIASVTPSDDLDHDASEDR